MALPEDSEDWRLEGDDGGDDEVGEGDQCKQKSIFLVEASGSKSRGSQGRGRPSVMKEGRKGREERFGSDPVKLSDLVCDKVCYSILSVSEAAKVVVDIECSINQKVISSKWAKVSKAQSGECGPRAQVQEVGGHQQLLGQVNQQAFGSGGAKGSVHQVNDKSKEKLEVSGSYGGRKASFPTRSTGSKSLEGTRTPMEWVDYGEGSSRRE